jgi:hypothetical protein
MHHPTRSALTVLALLAVLTPTPSAAGDDPPKEPSQPELARELRDMVKVDQDARQELIRSTTPGQPVAPAIVEKLTAIDRKNTARLKEIVDKHGWPGKSLVGTAGAQDAWLLVQHADRDPAFQKRCLELMAPLVARGEVSAINVAYLTDRVRVADGKPQVYGTQFRQVDGKMEPSPIEDEARVDERRKSVGLPPLAEYRKQLEEVYRKKP